ncbi:MAG TPA: hypothetical protein VE687_10790 [Stellaceae bacterium]|nr:hypothetical protein [Stellaceae bacterium]
MIPVGLSRSHEPAAAAEEHSDYLATEAHYLSLANRILAALRSGGVILVTGVPPAIPQALSEALRKSTRSRSTVIDIACDAGLNSEELSRATSAFMALPPGGGPTGDTQSAASGPPIFVFADADRLPDERLREIVEFTGDTGERGIAALLLARSSFRARLEEEALQVLKGRLVARFEFQELGPDEGIEFLRHQLAARQTRHEPRGVPAGALRGLTALVVLLTLGIGAFVFLQHHSAGESPAHPSIQQAVVPASAPGETPTAASGPVAPRLSATAAVPQPVPLTQETSPRDEMAAMGRQATSPTPEPTPVPPPSEGQQTPSREIAGLVTRGDGFLSAGDVASARLFYERAADAGSAAAALRLGATFDPGFLSRTGIRGISGDAAQAASWYHRARDLGDPVADRLQRLDRQRAGEPRSGGSTANTRAPSR